MGARNRRRRSAVILCRFWTEDGVWNAEALSLPIVVSGDRFEEAQNHLREAIDSHFTVLADDGLLEESLASLPSADQLPPVSEPDEPAWLRMPIPPKYLLRKTA